jgi:hypothetical protein
MKNPTAGKAKWAHLAIALRALAYMEATEALDTKFEDDTVDSINTEEFREIRRLREELFASIKLHRQHLPFYPEENQEGQPES